jgi:hypothetical protein
MLKLVPPGGKVLDGIRMGCFFNRKFEAISGKT